MNTLRDLLGMNPLRPLIAFGGDGGGGGGGGSDDKPAKTNQDRINEIYAASDNPWESNGDELNALVNDRSGTYSGGSTTSTSTTTTSSSNNDKPAPQAQKKTLGSVSQTGQYAGDGFEWVQNDNTNALTRVYTGANEDAGLGQDVIAGGTSDKDTKEAIANISLNEGSAFASSAASATDGDLLNLLNPDIEGTGRSDSYADQVGKIDYTPDITYDSTKTGAENRTSAPAPVVEPPTFGEVFAANRAAGNETFTYNGNLYTTDLAPAPAPAAPTFSYDAFGNAYDTPAAAAQADQVAEAQAAAAQNAITAASNAALDPRGDQIQSPTSNGAGIASLGEDDVMSQPVVTSASQEYLDSLPDFSYDFTADDTPSVTSGGPIGRSYGDDAIEYGNIAAIPLDGGGGESVEVTVDGALPGVQEFSTNVANAALGLARLR
jgi:hypothetical protein